MWAHKASREGKVMAGVIAGEPSAFDNRAIPAVVFTDPEIAWTGITEAEAEAEGQGPAEGWHLEAEVEARVEERPGGARPEAGGQGAEGASQLEQVPAQAPQPGEQAERRQPGRRPANPAGQL